MRATILVAALLGFLVGWSDYIVTLLIGGGQLLTAPVLLGSAAAGAGNDAAVAVMALATRRCAQQYLRLVQLEGFGRRSVSSLSGGQQQRVALARALAAERGALLLDEPFSSLDRELRVSMHDLLTEVRAALSPTVLLVTHDLDEAALAESTVGLIDGAVQQQAPMAELYRRPASLAVARLLGGFAEIPGTVRDGVHHSAWGRVRLDERAAESGTATLLIRRESLQLAPHDSSAAGVGVGARVLRRRPLGTRVIASLLGDDDSPVEVELPAGDDVHLGAHVQVRLLQGARRSGPSRAKRQRAPTTQGHRERRLAISRVRQV